MIAKEHADSSFACQCNRCRPPVRELLLGLCLLLLLPLVLVLMLVAMALLNVATFITLRWRLWRQGQRYYLICSARHGWHEFVVNNLTRSIPASFVPLWIDRRLGFLRELEISAIRSRSQDLAKPCLIEVTLFGTRARSLHAELLPFKQFGQSDETVQQTLAKLLEGATR